MPSFQKARESSGENVQGLATHSSNLIERLAVRLFLPTGLDLLGQDQVE